MSAPLIRAALETALATMAPPLDTAWQNHPFKPVVGAPYQRAAVLFADPEPMEMSQQWHRERGLLQINLCYPLGAGAGEAEDRAELIRETFHAGAEFTSGVATVRVERLPEVAPAMIEEDRFVVPVRVRFYAHILRS